MTIELRESPSAERNKAVILEKLESLLSSESKIFEIGSGTGQHADFFSDKQSSWYWQASDLEVEERDLLKRIKSRDRKNLPSPIVFDVHDELSPKLKNQFDVVYTANTLHIMPENGVEAFFSKAQDLLKGNGQIVIYGPFFFEDIETAPSNLAFSERLASEIPGAGIRKFKKIQAWAESSKFTFESRISMPANNFILQFKLQN